MKKGELKAPFIPVFNLQQRTFGFTLIALTNVKTLS